MTIKLGDLIPDFVLKDQHGNKVKLTDFKGKKVLLSFHPLAWTSICAKQMKSLESNFNIFSKNNAIALGINVDPVPSKKAWADELGIKNTRLLSDFWPHGEYSEKLGIFRSKDGFSERANIVLDQNHTMIFKKIYEIKQLPDIKEIIRML